MNPFEAKIFKNATQEEKLEICLNALGSFAKNATILAVRLGEIADRLEMIIQCLNAKSWEKAINQRLEERKQDASS